MTAKRVPVGFLRRGQIAERLGVGTTLVRYWQRTGKLAAVRDPQTGWWLSSIDDVRAFADREAKHSPSTPDGAAPSASERVEFIVIKLRSAS